MSVKNPDIHLISLRHSACEGGNPAPAGETMQVFEQRVTGAFEQVCDAWLAPPASHTDKPVWVVCHAGVMRVLMAHILDLKQQAQCCSLSMFPLRLKEKD
ncbi:MAG: histidine phosphatase family protein [Shewanella sp.]|nr:histidine phosphatase family protein [Shewanella sp.]